MENVNSTKNQRIKEKLVSRDVYVNVNAETEFILSVADSVTQDAPFTWDDVDNMYSVNWYDLEYHLQGSFEDDKKELFDHFGVDDFQDLEESEDLSEVQEYFEQYLDFEAKPAEVFEWWKVSSWLLEKLQQKGHVVIPHANIWGRSTTGQAILLDSVISEIASEMEILEGQKNEWKI